MSDASWRALYERIRSLPEGSQARLRYGAVVLMVERRGDVLLALRELPAGDDTTHRRFTGAAHPVNGQGTQLLRFGRTNYLCEWRRMPTDLFWLSALATASY